MIGNSYCLCADIFCISSVRDLKIAQMNVQQILNQEPKIFAVDKVKVIFFRVQLPEG